MTTKQLKDVADLHMKADSGLKIVRRLEAPESYTDSIVLLEVNDLASPSGTLVPVPIAASGEVPYSMVLIEVTPDEYQQIETGELALPEGWSLSDDLHTRE